MLLSVVGNMFNLYVGLLRKYQLIRTYGLPHDSDEKSMIKKEPYEILFIGHNILYENIHISN